MCFLSSRACTACQPRVHLRAKRRALTFSYLRWSLSPLIVLVAPSCTYLAGRHASAQRRRQAQRPQSRSTHFQSLVLMLSFQPASHDTYWLWITAFQLWPGGGAGTGESLPMLMMMSSAWMRRCVEPAGQCKRESAVASCPHAP
jgi:hypothetical protein